MHDKRKAEAIAAARREIARRVARFCTGLSPEEFDALLDRMAHVQWKYDTLPNIGEPPDIEQQLRELWSSGQAEIHGPSGISTRGAEKINQNGKQSI